MELRSLRKHFLFQRALKSFNRQYEVSLTASHVFVLYALYQCSKSLPCTSKNIEEKLQRNFHSRNLPIVWQSISLFHQLEWLHEEGAKTKRHWLSGFGHNVLKELERKLRTARVK